MKNTFSRLFNTKYVYCFLCIVSLIQTTPATAVPVYYTFSGYVDGLYGNTAPAELDGIAANSNVTYTLMLDLDQDAVIQYSSGRSETIPDSGLSDLFYAEYIGGDMISLPLKSNSETIEYYHGVLNNNVVVLTVGSALSITATSNIDQWSQDSVFSFQDIWGDTSDNSYGFSYGYASLIEISSTNPQNVPESPSIIILALGLTGLGLIRRRGKLSGENT